MSGNEENWDDEKMAALFAAAAGGGLPPDEEFLRQLRERSAEVFAASSQSAGEKGTGRPSPSQVNYPRKRSKMVLYTWRIAAGTVAAGIAALAWFFATGPVSSASSLGEALDKLAAVKTVHLQVKVDGKPGEAWARPGELRWNLADGTYQIARGERLWQIDEKANRAASKPAAYFRGEKKALDPLGLLLAAANGGLDQKSRESVLAARPIRRETRDAVECDLYEVTVPSAAGELRIEALVDCRTGLPRWLEAKRGRDGKFASLAAISVLAVDGPVPEDLFVVGDTLTEDGRVGIVSDAQGITAVKPAMAERWTPLDEGALVMPGDWLRTDLRGANAIAVRLVPSTRLTIGPGGLVEIVGPKQIRIDSGDVKVVAAEKSPVEVVGPDKQSVRVAGTQLFRVQNEKLARLEKDPLWLKGFEGRTVGESIGSLVATIDGRDTPLTVGYHKVTVDIRDQIARTVVEESFVNHTDAVLEGVFHFPLPADASISGFGMWIGDQLVEADVVEKQRAREIYEQILRERRDPGLLEWTGGNIFKARVFPIEAHSEKRIKITYTQVLPMRGNSYRYSYALQSELLKQHPLRELAIDVKLNSVLPLKSVSSPTHPVRAEQSAHSARVEFTAQEYTPTRDFEVVAEVDGRQSDVVMIPHRRGDDGYFMVLLTPPEFQGAEKGSPRELLPDGEPLDLLILADTSASLDRSARTAQAEFIAALAGSLTPKDKINLAGCDVECDWVFDKAVPATVKNIGAVREFLAARVSLGWTDLDKAFASALAKAGPKTRIVYVGDGIPTTGDADPVACANRLRRLYASKTIGGPGSRPVPARPLDENPQIPKSPNPQIPGQSPTCYAVSVGSSYEMPVLRAMASLGGGSVRQISGEHGPQAVARDLLGEITRPALRDLKVEFTGLRAARVYPETLPNLPAGGQQIILGRYLPEGKDQSGEVVVTGTLEGRPIRYASRISLADAEQGNSFIPRLWARMHLDYLLQQGASQTVQDEIVALSEEYHIMTPYTSLLVLESDADRERFAVARRFLMRDGEKFFAAGRDNVNYDLVQQQMRRAGQWRLGLRRSVLGQLSLLGRDPSLFQAAQQQQQLFKMSGFNQTIGGLVVTGGIAAAGSSGPVSWAYPYGSTPYASPQSAGPGTITVSGVNNFYSGGAYINGGTLGIGINNAALTDFSMSMERTNDLSTDSLGRLGDLQMADGNTTREWGESDSDEKSIEHGKADFFPEEQRPSDLSQAGWRGEAGAIEGNQWGLAVDGPGAMPEDAKAKYSSYAGVEHRALGYDLGNTPLGSKARHLDVGLRELGQRGRDYYRSSPNYGDWLGGLFPYLPAPPAKEVTKEPKKPWPAEAKALAASLLRTETLQKLEGGLRIEQETESFEPRFAETASRGTTLALVSPAAWLTRNQPGGGQTTFNWCDKTERGAIAGAFLLGRLRPAKPADLEVRAMGLTLATGMIYRLDLGYPESQVELKPQGENRVLLRMIRYPLSNPDAEADFLIDTARHVVVSAENRQEGRVMATTRYDDFVEVAGAWWPGRTETFDPKGRRTSLVTQKLSLLAAGELTAQIKRQLALRDRVQFLREPLPKLLDAKRALAAGKADFDDQIVLTDYFSRTQQWTRVMEHLAAAEKLAAEKPGMRWLRNAALNISRRREELKTRLMEEAARLADAGPLSLRERARVRADGDESRKPGAPSSLAPLPEGEGSNTRGLSLGDELFLAEHIVNQASGILEANEMLRLSEAIRPVYQRQPALTGAMESWRQRQWNYLQQTGQAQAALEALKSLAADYPHDYSLQQQYANALAQAGEHEAAYRLLRDAMGAKIEWLPYELESLRSTYCQLLQQQGRWSEVAEFLKEWLKRDPESSSPSAEYLGALVRLDKIDEANALAARWLKEGEIPGKLAPAVAARLEAAVSFMLGNCNGIYMQRLDEQWLGPLADAAIFFARHETQGQVAERIMNDGRFTQTDECRRVRKAAFEMLQNEIETLKPAAMQRLIGWAMHNDPAIEQKQWRKVAAQLRKRWDAEKKPEVKQQLAGPLVQILSCRVTPEWIAFLRVQYEQAEPEYRPGCAQQLFNALIAQPWSQAYEDEAFGLLQKLSEAEQPAVRLAATLGGLYQLTDRMVEARYQNKMKAVEHPEKLTRIELRTKQAEARKAAREGFADRLRKEMAKREGPIVAWLNVERLYLDVLAGRDLAKAADECWEFVGPARRKPAGDDDPQALLDEALRARYLTMLANLAARKGAAPQLADRLLKYVDAGIAAADKDDLTWQSVKYQLLVAIDRPKELEQALREWAAADGPVNRWRLALGYLLAEQGKLPEAITLFEAVAATDELGPAEYRTLADWYMVVGRRKDYERSMIAAYKTIQEWQLGNLLSQQLQPWQQRGAGQVPGELDQQVLLVFAALFEKSQSPQNYLWQLAQFYRETRDFRLLAGLADAVVGHTAGQVYPFVQGMTSVLGEVRDEATADSIVEQLAKVRSRAKTGVDHRALDLLEVLVERRAAEVINQPGPHVEKALAALQRAFKREWTPGEPRLMADFLAGLGHITQPALAAEQVRQMESLYREAAPGSSDRLHIALRLANVRWAYGNNDAAIDLLQLELGDYQRANGGVLPLDANDPLSTLISYFEQRGHHARGEQVLFEQLKHPLNVQQAQWLTERLYELYQNALSRDAEVSLGRGETLYRAVTAKIEAGLATSAPDYRYQLLSRLCSVYSTAQSRRIPGVADDLRAFAFKRFAAVIHRELNNYASMVNSVAYTLHTVAGPRDAMAFLIGEIEREPRWLRYANQDGWQQYGSTLVQWRRESPDLGDLEPRLLKIVLAELREDLRSGQSRNRIMYVCDSSDYWAAKESDFARVAEEVYAQRKDSGAAVAYLANYLYRGLHHYDRGIEMLLTAHARGLLDEEAQGNLVFYLHSEKRYGESIAILLPLVERRPDNIQYRVWLLRAYFCTKQPAQLLALLKQTDEHFHKDGRWSEGNIAALAASCLDNKLFEQSVKYYQEVIPLHQRTQPNRGIGNGTLSEYYRSLARAFAGLKKTAEAVEAACGAVVSWGPQAYGRAQALIALYDVIEHSPDLDAYVAQLDKKDAETGLQNPIVRKAIGQAYLNRGEFAKALVQLRLAIELQPNDMETQQALLSCYDQQGDEEGAVRQLLSSVELSRRDIKLYEDLGRRYEALKRPGEAERAVTSIVEMAAAEAESHAALAEIRQRQDRWSEAIDQWRQVARLRALEPTGLLKLAEAQIHQRRWDDAESTVGRLEARSWPSRFNDVPGQARQLRRQIDEGRKAK
jgi:Flp pilus assembly protein TadD